MEYKKLIFVSGKGGTGKTTLSLLLAGHLARQGRKVLYVELSERSSAQHLLPTQRHPQYQPTPTGFGFDCSRLLGMDCLIEYISSFTLIEQVAQKLFQSVFLSSLVNVAPGLNDLAILGKLTSDLRQHGPGFNYDHIIVDSHSTGSFFSMLKAPATLSKSVNRGPLKKQSESIENALKNQNLSQYFIVGLFEDLPVDEVEETIDELKKHHEQQLHIVMNKYIPIDNFKIKNNNWLNFMGNKISKQKECAKRVNKMWTNVYQVPFFVNKLNESHFQHGDFLRQSL